MKLHLLECHSDVSHTKYPLTREQIESWILNWLSARDDERNFPFDTNTPFAEMGLGSIDAVEFSAELSCFIGYPLDSTIVWQFPTITSLIDCLVDKPSPTLPTSLDCTKDKAEFSELDEQGMADALNSLLRARH
jgi:acyl carrier protein